MTTDSSVETWVAHSRTQGWTCPRPPRDAYVFHQMLEGYQRTPLVRVPALADELSVGQVLIKDESSRLGLPAFKALGASWAIHRALNELAPAGHVTLVTATDGNHGRAVAKFARLSGHQAAVYIPDGVHPAAVQAIEAEGAEVFVVGGSYDEAVAAAATAADKGDRILVQDTSSDDHDQIPSWIVDGYGTLFTEIDQQLQEESLAGPDLVAVPVGVGALLHAALTHYRSQANSGTAVISVEPVTAACVLASVAAGAPVSVQTGATIMTGLNCGTPSSLAWPAIAHGLDAAVAVTDAEAARAVKDLHGLDVSAGPCGAAGLAGVRRALTGPGNEQRRTHLGIGKDSAVVLLVTEGSEANPAVSPT